MKLTYIGRRVTTDNKLSDFYLEVETDKKWAFKKRLHVVHTIGAIIEVEPTATGVKGPYKVVGQHSNDADITQWSVLDVKAVQEHKEMKENAKTHDAHIDRLIEAVKKNTYTAQERRRVVSYIIQKLM